jgi:hypothetical protein
MSNGPRGPVANQVPTLSEAVEAAVTEVAKSPAERNLDRDARTVWVDVDATLAIYHGWNGVYVIGPPIGGAIQFMRSLRELGKRLDFRVGLYTVRTTCAYPGREQVLASNPQIGTEPELVAALVKIVEQWALASNIEFDHVWCGQGKPVGIAYIDDRGVHCSPQTDGPVAYQAALGMVEMIAKPRR